MTCEGCGAALPAGKPGEVVRCAYCAREKRMPGSAPAPKPKPAPAPPPTSSPAPARRRNKGNARAVLTLLAIAAVVIGAVWVTSVRKGPGVIGAEDMHRAPEGKWFVVSLDGMQGDRDHFDVIANYPWALTLARGWSPDVVVERIEVQEVRHDGVGPDVTDRRNIRSARYRFTSPSRLAAAKKMAEVSTERTFTGITISLSENRVLAMIDHNKPSVAMDADPELGCSMAKVIAKARTSDRLPKRPVYRVWLRTVGTPPRWVWSVDAGRSAMVDARTCQLVR